MDWTTTSVWPVWPVHGWTKKWGPEIVQKLLAYAPWDVWWAATEGGSKHHTRYKPSLKPGLKLALTLRHLASGSAYANMQYGWRVPHNTMSVVVREAKSQAIIDEYLPEVMNCPYYSRGMAWHICQIPQKVELPILRMLPDSATLFCKDSRMSLSGFWGLFLDDEWTELGSSRSFCISAHAVSAQTLLISSHTLCIRYSYACIRYPHGDKRYTDGDLSWHTLTHVRKRFSCATCTSVIRYTNAVHTLFIRL